MRSGEEIIVFSEKMLNYSGFRIQYLCLFIQITCWRKVGRIDYVGEFGRLCRFRRIDHVTASAE